MSRFNIQPEEREKLEIERRNCLARYLIHQKSDRRRLFLNRMKSADLREDLKERMREQLSIHIASLDTNMRNLRLSRLYKNCQRTRKDQAFFQDVLRRVNQKLPEDQQQHG